ncbi:uncharacterized protein RHOBADRAFT_51078 [Rhodotorula graminis WP1]|uniref:Uncharacterized protein n=1 Tax=Rhodotorula graminis (strain WP1) TaxID=578459 RepID=A0A194SD20_RHOGW|nr:uncharacterized protein RHOBADRAFT_51078 [Rhodotorula graminis WP1]KPV78633.1 hypothetical protein RHOBADRAFT_51078 [Rhodotorula graminis WP1]
MALHLPAHTLSDAPPSPITGVHLNADRSVFATSTTEGWVVYRTQPLEVLTRRDLPDASLRIVLPLERSNLVFLVGGPPSPLYPPNKVVLWDARAQGAVAELEFREDVRGVRARRDRLVVVLRRRVVLFVLGEGDAGIWREGAYETCDNPRGLAALATAPHSTLLAFPGRQPGQVQLVRLPPLSPPGGDPPLPPPPSHDPTAAPHPATSVLLAHESPLAALATCDDGRVLATGSSRGTLVRIWDAAPPARTRAGAGGAGGGGAGAPGGTLARELRRGTDGAEIFDVALSREGDRTPRSHQLSLLKPYLPKYFSSEWSHAQFRLPPPPGGPTASRLPFSLSNPGPYPHTPFSGGGTSGGCGGGAGGGGGGEGGKGPRAASVEDDVCVCAWIEVDALDEAPAAAAAPVVEPRPRPRAQGRSSSSAQQQQQQQHGRSGAAASSTTSTAPPPRRKETQLVALTRSGGWYRLAFDPLPAPSSASSTSSHAPSSSSSSSSTKGKAPSRPSSGTSTPRAERDPGVKGLARDSTGGGCRLVEYRRLGGVEGW